MRSAANYCTVLTSVLVPGIRYVALSMNTDSTRSTRMVAYVRTYLLLPACAVAHAAAMSLGLVELNGCEF